MEDLYDFEQTIRGIVIDSEDNIFVSNSDNYSIDKVSLNNGKVSITQSTKIPSSPFALAINSKNEIYIGTDNGQIMKMTKEGIISSIAGNGKIGFADGIGKNAKIGIVYGICFDKNDIAYFCDYNYSAIRKLTTDGKITTICGGESGFPEEGFSDGKRKQAKFNTPTGIVYNYSTKLFCIADFINKSIRTMTVDGNVKTLCKYSDYLLAIAIDGEGKLYVSTNGGELMTVDSKGEIKQMNINVKDCNGLAFNSKGDLFFISDRKLCVIRNCTKYPPHSLLSPITNINTKVQSITKVEFNQELKTELANVKSKLVSSETEKQKYLDNLKKLETKLKELEQKETKEPIKNELLEWLNSIKLANLFPILQDLGVKDLEFLKLIEESDFEGTNIKVVEKRMLFQSIKKLKENSAIKGTKFFTLKLKS